MNSKKIPIELPKSSINPELLVESSNIQFKCSKEVACWNICCKNADVTLAPYDIIVLKKHFNISSGEFLDKYTVPFAMDGKGLTGVKLKTNEQKHCVFLNSDGCSVYEKRPSACRYYPLGIMVRKVKEEKDMSVGYCMIKEDHCLGHNEDRVISVVNYQQEQQVATHDKHNLEWMQILLKKSSAGPAIGQITDLGLQLFFMCSFDIDRFRKFINSASFRKTYKLTDDFFNSLQDDDIALLSFSYRFMRQVFFADNSIDLVHNVVDKRLKSRKDIIKMRRTIEIKNYNDKQEALKKEVCQN